MKSDNQKQNTPIKKTDDTVSTSDQQNNSLMGDLEKPLLSDVHPREKDEQQIVKKKPEVVSRNHMLLGAIIQMISIIALALQQVFAKLQFNKYTEMTEVHYIFLRCSIQIFIQLIWLNTEFKYYVWGSLTKDNGKQLMIRVVIGFFALTTQVIAVRNLPLVLVSIMMNTMPLFTAVFGFFILGETLRILEKICLVLSFVGVTIMITGKDTTINENATILEDGTAVQTQYQNYSLLAIIALCFNPILSSLVTVTLRNLRGIGIHTQAFYHALGLVGVMGTIILINGDTLPFLSRFSIQDYSLLIGAAFFALTNQLLKQMAVQYDTASRVTMYNYLQSLIQLVFDIVVFNYAFQIQELIGILLVFVVNVFLICKILSTKGKK
eukprot:403337172